MNQTRSLSRQRRVRELVEQLLRSILPRLSVQIVNDNVRCSSFGNLRPPRLTVLALVTQQPSVTNPAAP